MTRTDVINVCKNFYSEDEIEFVKKLALELLWRIFGTY